GGDCTSSTPARAAGGGSLAARAAAVANPALRPNLRPKRGGSASAEPALGWPARCPGIDRRAHVLVAEVDTTLVEVVGRHFHGHAVTGQDADAVLFHAPGGIGDDFMPIVELHATARVRQDLRDHTFELEHVFLGHAVSLFDGPR